MTATELLFITLTMVMALALVSALGFYSGLHVQSKKLKKQHEEAKEDLEQSEYYEEEIRQLQIKNKILQDSKAELQLSELVGYMKQYTDYSEFIHNVGIDSPEIIYIVLNILIIKEVDLHLVSWAAPDYAAYNVAIGENGYAGRRALLTKEEFDLICKYGQKLADGKLGSIYQ